MNILLPNEPMVMVQRFGKYEPESGASVSPPTVQYMAPQKARTSTPVTCSRDQLYEFVNSNKPDGNKDPATRKIVRCHARHGNTSKLQRHLSRYEYGSFSTNGKPISKFDVPSILGEPTSLSSYSYPIEMKPGTHALLDKIGRAHV